MDDTSTRMRRVDMDDTSARMRRVDMDDTSARMRRVEMDDTSTRMRRVEMDDTSTRMRRYADDDEPAPRSRRRAEMAFDEGPRGGRRRAEMDEYEDVPRQRGRYDEEPPRRGGGTRFEPRFGGEAEDAPRARRDRGADIERADSGRHSRSEFVGFDDEPDDETPTLVDMASRRARRAEQESVRVQAGRGARRGGRGRTSDDVADDEYWSQLRGEAN
jgi:hypothetical protein